MKAIVGLASLVVLTILPTMRQLAPSSVEAAHLAQAGNTCQNIQLLIRANSSQGAAGHLAINYRIHNLTDRACTLFGYPGVQLLDRHFASLPTTVHRGGGFLGAIPRQLVHLRRYGNAYFTLGYSDVPVNNQPCEMAPYLMIFAPNDFLPVVTYASPRGGVIVSCSGNLDVTPVTAQPRY